MKLAASLVEHLVTGTGALIWIALLLAKDAAPGWGELPGWVGVLMVPILYGVGILLDYIAHFFLRPIESIIIRRRRRIWGDEKDSRLLRSPTVAIILKSRELAEMLELRAVRQRIARGAFVNLLLATLILMFFGFPQWLQIESTRLLILLALFLPLSFGCWIRFQNLYEDFRIGAFKALENLGYLERIDGMQNSASANRQ